MATMTWQDLINLQNQYPGASRDQLAAIYQQQQANQPVDTSRTMTNPLPTPETASSGATTPTTGGFTYTGATNMGQSVPYPTGITVPAGTPTTTGTSGGGTGTGTPTTTPTNDSAQAFFNQLFPGQTLTPQMLADNEAALNANGIKVIRNASNQPSKISLPDGTVIDPIIGAGSGQNQKAWNVVSGPGGASLGGAATSANNPWGAMGQMMGSLGYNVAGSFAPWTQTWSAPTAEQALNSPGVQFALQNSMRTMENSAAAQGVLGNARAQEAIANNLGQQLLGNYNQIFNQALTGYQQNQADFFANQDRPWAKGMQVANMGLQASSV